MNGDYLINSRINDTLDASFYLHDMILSGISIFIDVE